MSYHAQQGEDQRLHEIINTLKKPIPQLVVDVGAGDGEFLSNTRFFIEDLNYKGIMIEPSDEPWEGLERLYAGNKNVKCLKIAITERPYNYVMDIGWMGTITHWTLNHVKEQVDGKLSIQLSKLLKSKRVKDIGILSIDTEGYDTKILRELIENSKIRPVLIIIEVLNSDLGSEQIEILKDDYILKDGVQFNNIFLRKDYA